MWSLAPELLGGLGLLLVGMSLMTDGLKLAAGNALRGLLARWTNTRLRGLLAGFLITALVQSSSAVTVATIGFANAGMLSLERAIWVIFGSNVGTTMTAWIVALVGFKVDIEAFALPLVGIGALLKLTGAQTRRGSYGLALVGFALLFLGIGTLKGAFDGLSSSLALPATEHLTVLRLLACVGIGIVLTTLMQSSSAAMVIALSAADSGLVPLHAAAAIVIGANLGTTSTALLTIIGATPNARRVAISHVCFNLITALVALALLGPLLWLLSALQSALGLEAAPAVTLAIFHTAFNLLGVLLMWPLSSTLVRVLASRFRRVETEPAQPRFLDRSTLGVPFTAASGMALEIRRIALLSGEAIRQSLPGTAGNGDAPRQELRALAAAVDEFAAALNRSSLTPYVAGVMPQLIESLQQYLLVASLTGELDRLGGHLERDQLPPDTVGSLEAFIHRAGTFTRDWQAALEQAPGGALPEYPDIEQDYRQWKAALLHQAATGTLSITRLDQCLQYMQTLRQACLELWKANTQLHQVLASLQGGNPEAGTGDAAIAGPEPAMNGVPAPE